MTSGRIDGYGVPAGNSTGSGRSAMAESPMDYSLQPHVLLFPFPFVGHINPVLRIARCLSSSYGFRVTVLMTGYRLSQLKKKTKKVKKQMEEEEEDEGEESAEEREDGINFEVLPASEGICEEDHEGVGATPRLLRALDKIGESGAFERWVQELRPPVTCLISDTLVSWTQLVVDKLGIPRAAFWASCATSYLFCCHPDQGNGVGEDDSVMSMKIVGICDELPRVLLPTKANSLRYVEKDKTCNWLIINTSRHLEMEQIQSLEANLPKAKVLSTFSHEESSSLGASLRVLENKEDARCLEWLDSKPACSVLYIAFGSLVSLGRHELHQLALGLENSKKHFLWVLRSSSSTSCLLPPGFVERTREQGLIVSWAPQLDVLAHPSVSCFLHHSGWNSTMEGLAMGVPLLALPPEFADLRIIGWYIEHVWHVGLYLDLEKLSSIEVEKAVWALMGEAPGTITSFHRNAALISQVLQNTSQQRDLQLFAQEVIKIASTKQKTMSLEP